LDELYHSLGIDRFPNGSIRMVNQFRHALEKVGGCQHGAGVDGGHEVERGRVEVVNGNVYGLDNQQEEEVEYPPLE
jgi:hypothetical protein